MYGIIQFFMIDISHLKFCGYVAEIWEKKVHKPIRTLPVRRPSNIETKHYATH
jgi:hypothetical protein